MAHVSDRLIVEVHEIDMREAGYPVKALNAMLYGERLGLSCYTMQYKLGGVPGTPLAGAVTEVVSGERLIGYYAVRY
jgi:hypothetical protein